MQGRLGRIVPEAWCGPAGGRGQSKDPHGEEPRSLRGVSNHEAPMLIPGPSLETHRLRDAPRDEVFISGANPLSDVSCLQGQGEHIPLVMKAGRMQLDRLNP